MVLNRGDMPIDYKSNGCGSSKARFDYVPDSIFGVSITEACRIHDYMYSVGKTLDDKYQADLIFLSNMLVLVERNTSWWYPTTIARNLVLKYYEAVVYFGEPAFFEGKYNG